MTNNIYIVTRHEGSVQWLRSKGFEGEILPHLNREQIKGGSLYIGVLPIPLIKEILDVGSRFFLLVLPELVFSQRSRGMTADEIDQAGACLMEVKRVDLMPVEMPVNFKNE